MRKLILTATLAMIATGCQDDNRAVDLFGKGETEIEYYVGPLGSGLKIENDKDVNIILENVHVNPETKEIVIGRAQLIDSASSRLDAMGRFAPQWGQHVMPQITAYRHMNNVDANTLLKTTLDSVERLASMWQPYIAAKADSITRKSLEPSLVDHIVGMMIQGAMPKGLLSEMAGQAPGLGAAVSAALANVKQSINSVDPAIVPFSVAPQQANPIDTQTLTDIGKPKPATNLPPRRSVNADDLTPAELPVLPSRDDVRREFALSEVVQAGLPEMELVRFK